MNKEEAAAKGRARRYLPLPVAPTTQDAAAATHPPAQLWRASTAQPEAVPRPAAVLHAGSLRTNHQQARRGRTASPDSHWPYGLVVRIGWKAPRPRERAELRGQDSLPILVPGLVGLAGHSPLLRGACGRGCLTATSWFAALDSASIGLLKLS